MTGMPGHNKKPAGTQPKKKPVCVDCGKSMARARTMIVDYRGRHHKACWIK
jgi:hypothetical protein